jgi:hypothetical protein
MTVATIPRKYFPGIYPGKRYDPAQAAGLYIKAWEQKRREQKQTVEPQVEFPPAICFARQIGVGALEIDDLDREQGTYFKKLTGKRERPTDEFDLLINRDYMADPEWVAEIVETAFRCKFKS